MSEAKNESSANGATSNDLLCNMDKGPWQLFYRQNGTLCGVSSDDFTHDVVLKVDGDFAEGDKERYCNLLLAKLNGA